MAPADGAWWVELARWAIPALLYSVVWAVAWREERRAYRRELDNIQRGQTSARRRLDVTMQVVYDLVRDDVRIDRRASDVLFRALTEGLEKTERKTP